MTDAPSSMRHRDSEPPDAQRQDGPIQDPAQLTAFRVASGMSLRAAARKTGVSPGHLSELENWKATRRRRRGASPELLAELAETYSCTVDELMLNPPRRLAG